MLGAHKIKEEQEKIDPVTNEPMLDKDGMPIMEEVEIKIPAFRVVPVFDVSQTDGKELPELSVDELSADVDGYQDFMKALEAVSPAPIEYEDIAGEAKGYFSTTMNRIAIQEGMSESQTVKTAIHEVAHAKLHSREREKETDLSERKDRNTKEVEAESVAYTVCQHFGIDTSDYSFGYIAGWSSGKEMTELKSSLDTIRRTASELISGIETQLQELQKERVTEAEQTQDIVLLVANTDRSEYYLLNVRGMSGEELVASLAAMNDDDRLSVEAYLESKGGWVTPLADEQTEEVQEYHLDYVYNTDTYEITDVKARMAEQDKVLESEEPDAELSIMQQAEQLINEMEREKTIFSDDERNLIVNYAYKLGDMEKTRELVEHIAMYEENSPNLVAQTVINAQAEIDALPDGMVGLSEMYEYGYTWAEMLPLTQERALELFDHDLPVYRLYEDGSEATIEDRAEVMEHSGMFGIEKDDWNAYLEHQTMREELEESSANREAQLLYGRDNQFGIYQLNDSPQARDIHFMNSDFLEMKGIAITRENYDLVYTAPLEEGTSLEDIFTQFNIDRPEDFRGHSLSVSDVVVLHQNGENTCHFVDSFGYKEVPEFIQEIAKEREAEQTSVIDETMEVLGEIAEEHAGEEPERENAVFLVNYNEWKDVGELDLGQNYFAIDDPYGDGDYRLLWLQNQIKDINPITEGKTGTLATYLPVVESYLAEKREAMQKEVVTEAEQKETVVTLTVAKCGEFHNLGKFHEGIETVEEAIRLFNEIPPERMNGIPSIGIHIHTEGAEPFEDVEMDVVSGKVVDLEMLEYVPDISDNPKAIEVIGELIDKLPDIEVRGSLEKFQTAILAAQIDQLSYDYDTYQYRDTVDDRDAQIATIAEDIRSGNMEYLHDFLNAIVSDGIREGIVDMFGRGMDTDNSEAIQTVRKAQELLDKLSSYKPLAKVEELEEGNYNMVDNVLNNGLEKKEQERMAGRISIREKLAEKKAAIEHKDKTVQKDQDRKTQREM